MPGSGGRPPHQECLLEGDAARLRKAHGRAAKKAAFLWRLLPLPKTGAAAAVRLRRAQNRAAKKAALLGRLHHPR
jgi:hypothetical protein